MTGPTDEPSESRRLSVAGRCLITGGAGFIGSNLADTLVRGGAAVTVLDSLERPGSGANLAWLRSRVDGDVRVVEADVRDARAVEQAVRDADVVYHLAGQTAVSTSLLDPRRDFEANALGTLNVLEAARGSSTPPVVVYASTNKVYGGLERLPVVEEATRYRFQDLPRGIDESHALAFHSPYGCSKGVADQYVLDYARIYGLPATVFRQSCVYGPRQLGSEEQGWVTWLAAAVAFGKPITIYGTGKQVRDLLHVTDLVDAYLRATEAIDVTRGQAYNIGGGFDRTVSIWHEFAPLLSAALERSIPAPAFAEARPGDQPVFFCDTSKAETDFGWRPQVGLEDGLAWLVSWVLENEELLVGGGCDAMKVLLALTYYRPHLSGLTIYVERLARMLAERGHEVTVLTSRHPRALPRLQEADGVCIVRVPVAFHVSKGVIMPTYPVEAVRQVRAHDVVSIHLPQFEAWVIALCARVLGRPSVLTYHCDLRLPAGAVNRVAERAVGAANALAAGLADRIVAYTQDYADHTPLLRRHEARVAIVPPPVVMRRPATGDVESFRRRHGLDGAGPLIGLATRFAAEKGIDVLLDAVPRLVARHPEATVVCAGQHEGVVGEEAYRRRLAPSIDALGDRWRFLGALDPVEEMPAFFGAVDCLVLPSVNSTESFGLVQGEAMLCGTPVVASDLPGVRQSVLTTGMGEIVPVGDAPALAAAVLRVLDEPGRYARDPERVARHFDPGRTIDGYETLFRELVGAE